MRLGSVHRSMFRFRGFVLRAGGGLCDGGGMFYHYLILAYCRYYDMHVWYDVCDVLLCVSSIRMRCFEIDKLHHH